MITHLAGRTRHPGLGWRTDAPSAAQTLSASNYSANDYIKHRAGGADGEDGPRRDPPQPHTSRLEYNAAQAPAGDWL